jgi:hypothetical protein
LTWLFLLYRKAQNLWFSDLETIGFSVSKFFQKISKKVFTSEIKSVIIISDRERNRAQRHREEKEMVSRKEIFKRAWQIKREDSRNIFSLCLKMAWAEAKQMKVESREEKIERLSQKYNRWTKGGYDRIYFNAKKLGLVAKTNRYGNVSEGIIPSDNDQWVSAGAVKAMLEEKSYLDLKTGELVIGFMTETYFGDVIRAEVA